MPNLAPESQKSERHRMAPRRTRAKPINREGRAPKLASARTLSPELSGGAASGSAQERDTMRVRVYRALARGLMAGMFKPGEAVSRLIAERALILLPNRSVIVPRMSRARFTELSETRQMLEGMMAEAACARATPALLRQLTEINETMKRC